MIAWRGGAKFCDSLMAITSRVIFLNAIAATALAGCAVSDDSVGRFLVKPDKYVLYNCTELAKAAQATRSRQRELEMLMAKAETDSVGVLVSGAAYRPEHVQLRGIMNELQKTAVDKNCKFVPSAENLEGDVEYEPSDIYGLPGGRR